MIRVGALNDKIAKISITNLPHNLIQLPFLACIILIAVLRLTFIVVLAKHVLEDLTYCLDFSLSDYYGFLSCWSALLYDLFLGYPDFLSEFLLDHFELVAVLFLGLLFGGGFAWPFGAVLDDCSVEPGLAEGGFEEIVLFLHE